MSSPNGSSSPDGSLPKLFTPLRVGDIDIANRVVMAPLTRNRATHGTDAPNELHIEYYRQRAGAGLIISEGTQISQQGQGYVWTPGIYSREQVARWKPVTEAVHAAGGKIVAQIWHVGRVSHVSLQPGQQAPVAPSAIRAETKTYIESGFAEVSQPRELRADELPGIVADYAQAALNAREAGFDGVELHGANGYLIDQFLRDGTNRRTDAYGGSVENRARFPLEVVDAVVKAIGKGRVGIRISPVSPANGVSESDPQAVFGSFAAELGKRGLAFLHVIEGATGGPRDIAPFDWQALRKAFGGVYIANNGFTREMALEAVESGRADAVAFGKAFIANPDLVERLKRDAAWNALDAATLYGGGAKGYTDYPTLA